MPTTATRLAPGTLATYRYYGATYTVRVVDPALYRQEFRDSAPLLRDYTLEGYALVTVVHTPEGACSLGWTGYENATNEATLLYWVNVHDLTVMTSTRDPQALLNEVRMKMLATDTAIAAFRRTSGQARAFTAARTRNSEANEIITPLEQMIIASL